MINETLTMIPGPTPVHPRILAALARPTVSHVSPPFVKAFRAALDDFKALCQSAAGQPVIVGGGGTLAMEIALVNVVAPGERVLVISQGYFGDRYAELAGAFGIECDVLRSEWGKAVAVEEVARHLKENTYAAVTITHVDTSTGTQAPVAKYCELLRGRKELVILDGVCATGGIDEPCDTWGIDVLLTAPQKAIAAPPGVALCMFSPRAIVRRQSRSAIPAYYADLMRWLPIMQDPGKYYSTPCVNEIFALGEALRMVHEEGLPARFARHARTADAFRAGLEAVGLKLFTAPECRADTLSVVRHAAGVDDAAFRREMAARGVVVAGGLGPIAGKAFRIGHMGNIGAAEVAATLDAVEGSLHAVGVKVEPGTAVAAAASHFAAAHVG
ncbi:MAG TPA: alanine--glyoxylate aminotransferase family protein [Thermoanaerobaculaceae bacterium]|nr:alanine--glyoxylate aminotransferase family protein [Thermoanaerobaculaceae bacterium]